ncbi:hypothetical protein M378DRAFT_24321 [Amanita muscaria Koide BX008]|uniref:Uncharacterized protein n=1 Tax=Amanita muscaria (strain Koide BX008) TaxID=946122 RepID=A0A0C2TDD5_AMAMK|nr:hypothetical protein M378DRAFT_24321 [Amanita muscaria Koide BX008]
MTGCIARKLPSSSSSRTAPDSSGRVASPPESVVSREDNEGGYESMFEKNEKKDKKKVIVSSILRRKSLQMQVPSRYVDGDGGTRDYVFLRLPTSGIRCIVALSPGVCSLVSGFLAYGRFDTQDNAEGFFYLYSIDFDG